MDVRIPNVVPQMEITHIAKISDTAASKSHISQAKAIGLNKMAQQKSQEEIAKNISAQYDLEMMQDNDFPMIRHAEKPLTSKAQVLLMMAKYQSITGNMDDHQRANALAIFATQSEANIQKAREFLDELDKLNDEFDLCSDEVNAAKKIEDQAMQKVSSAESKLSDVQKKTQELLQQLGAHSVDDPAVSDHPEVLAAKQAVADAEKNLAEARSHWQVARATTENKLNLAQQVLDNINAKTAEINKKYGDLLIPAQGCLAPRSAVEESDKALSRTAIMIKLITEFIMKMDEVASEKLQSDLELNRIQTKARQAEMKRKSDEYEEQVRKAEEAQKMAGCIGKILGGVAIALGAITTVFGGAGVALMAIGIALMVADPIVEAMTGKSLTGMVMDPLMEHVFMPLMDVLGDVVSKIFDCTPLGLLLKAIDKATGANMMETIHTVVTAAVAIAAIVAIALVAKSAAKFMIEKMTQAMTSAIMQSIKKAIAQVINKMLPKIVNNMTRQGTAALNRAAQASAKQISRISQQITNKLDSLSQKVNDSILNVLKPSDPEVVKNMGKMALNRIDMLRTGVQTSMPLVQGGMNINVANIQLQASKALADFDMASVDISILRDLLSTIISRFKQDGELHNSMNLSLSETLKNMADSSRFIIKNIQA